MLAFTVNFKMLSIFRPVEASKPWHSHQNVSPSDFLLVTLGH